MSEHPIERLSAWIDGDLDPAERERVERHVAGCAECAAVLAGLERVVASARKIEDREPATDLWPGIEGRLGARRPAVVPIDAAGPRVRRRFSFTVPQLAAAAIAIIVVSSAVVWWANPGPSDVALDERGGRVGTIAPGPQGIPVAFEEDPAYTDALADLERAFESSRDRLRPETVATVERNLAIIDEAIRQTLEALAADPGSTFLYDHLERSRRQKLEVLRQATL
ncbi:MAG: anti-sigma factor family protein, partial [Gemmatimonadota bacterium]